MGVGTGHLPTSRNCEPGYNPLTTSIPASERPCLIRPVVMIHLRHISASAPGEVEVPQREWQANPKARFLPC